VPGIGRIVVASSDPAWAAWQREFDYTFEPDPPDEPFHFGRRLAGICAAHGLERLLYLGGGSMPLLPRQTIAEAVETVATAPGACAVANNVHSTDWLAVSTAEPIVRLPHRLPRDNSLGWVLRTEAGVDVRGLAPTAATRVDIDTPFDGLLLSLYPGLGGELGGYLARHASGPARQRLRAALRVLATPGSQVALVGCSLPAGRGRRSILQHAVRNGPGGPG
jgi:hypothetical protein